MSRRLYKSLSSSEIQAIVEELKGGDLAEEIIKGRKLTWSAMNKIFDLPPWSRFRDHKEMIREKKRLGQTGARRYIGYYFHKKIVALSAAGLERQEIIALTGASESYVCSVYHLDMSSIEPVPGLHYWPLKNTWVDKEGNCYTWGTRKGFSPREPIRMNEEEGIVYRIGTPCGRTVNISAGQMLVEIKFGRDKRFVGFRNGDPSDYSWSNLLHV